MDLSINTTGELGTTTYNATSTIQNAEFIFLPILTLISLIIIFMILFIYHFNKKS